MPIAADGMDFTVRSAQGNYDVRFCASIADIVAHGKEPGTISVIDRAVYDLYSPFSAIPQERCYLLAAIEDEKSLAGLERLCLFLQSCGASRGTRLLVVGGGITQDISTLAAHLYHRGISYVFAPTTLLAMADSCIGAKSAVNLGALKNQIGAFHSPRQVMIWTGFLRSLSEVELLSGYGEIIKLAIASGEDQFLAAESLAKRGPLSPDGLAGLIAESLLYKRSVIEIDEYDNGPRKTLNYGHTFGHALEALTEHKVPHGIAVAWGVDVANYVAYRLGLIEEKWFMRLHEFLLRVFTFTFPAKVDASGITTAMQSDKKAHGAVVKFVIPSGFGALNLVDLELPFVELVIDEYLKKYGT